MFRVIFHVFVLMLISLTFVSESTADYLKIKDKVTSAKIYKKQQDIFLPNGYLKNKHNKVFMRIAKESNATVCDGDIVLIDKIGWVCAKIFENVSEIPAGYIIYGQNNNNDKEKLPAIPASILEEVGILTENAMQIPAKKVTTEKLQRDPKEHKKQLYPNQQTHIGNTRLRPDAKNFKKSMFKKSKDKKKPKTTIDTVEVIPGENAILIIAGNHPNRIITPFESPVVHTTSQAKFEVIGSVIYVTASLDAGPSTLFVTEEDDETMALSLTLVPKAIPPKEIHLKLKHPQFIQISSPKAKKWEASLPYVDMLKNVITKIAKGEIPPGYNLRNITSYDPVPVCETNISLEPKQVIDGHRIQVIISRATNITNKKMLFNEASCYQNKVLAVAVWPNALLEPGQSTELYVIFKKEYGRQHSKRPSLVQ